MRSENEADQLISLGAERKNIQVVGSMKFDLAYEMSQRINADKVKESLGIEQNREIVIFGSLHTEEEEPIINVAEKLLKQFKDLLVVIVPRYLDKTGVFHILNGRELNYIRKSEMPSDKQYSIIVVDTYSDLNNFYAYQSSHLSAEVYTDGADRILLNLSPSKNRSFRSLSLALQRGVEKDKESGE